MSELSISLIIGIMVGIVLVVLLLKFMNKNGKAKTEYDERQKIERGKAYTVGFYVTVLTCAVMLVLQVCEAGVEKLGMAAWFLPILAGVVAQISYSIFHDAYEGLNTNTPRFFVVMAIVGGMNLAFAIIALARNGFFKDGVLAPGFINLLCGILFLIMAVELLLKHVMDQRREREDA